MKKIIYAFLLVILIPVIAHAQTPFGINVSGAYISPMGDFGDLYKSGIGAQAAVTYDIALGLQLNVSAGYTQLSFNNDKFNELLNGMGITEKVNVDSKITIIPIMAGARYYFTGSGLRPYAALDLGLHFVSVGASSVNVGGQTFPATVEQSKATTAWGIGGGFLIQVAPKISLDISAKMNGNGLESGTDISVSGPGYSSSQSSKSTTTYFSVGAGIHIDL